MGYVCFQEPFVSYLDPDFGPVAGGTMVTISGDNLGVGNRQVTDVKLEPGHAVCENPYVYPDVRSDARLVYTLIYV